MTRSNMVTLQTARYNQTVRAELSLSYLNGSYFNRYWGMLPATAPLTCYLLGTSSVIPSR